MIRSAFRCISADSLRLIGYTYSSSPRLVESWNKTGCNSREGEHNPKQGRKGLREAATIRKVATIGTRNCVIIPSTPGDFSSKGEQ